MGVALTTVLGLHRKSFLFIHVYRYQVVFFFGDDGVSHGDCFPDDFHPAPNPHPLFLFLFSVCPAWLGSEGGKEGRKIRTRGGEICSWMGLAVPPYLLPIFARLRSLFIQELPGSRRWLEVLRIIPMPMAVRSPPPTHPHRSRVLLL